MNPITSQDPLARSLDVVTNNAQRLQQLFPEAFSEGKVDMDVLRELLGEAVDEREEKYGLNWHGKRRARQIALTPSAGTLRPVVADSVEWNTTNNLLIEGDNLEVLKLLQKSYAGQVKLIYIDPPYNTGKDFVYPDNFQDNIKNYQELTGQVEGGKKISSNTETSGRFHTEWLNMMYPRLKLARNLLREDGVIIFSIDDTEFSNSSALLNDIFGEENQLAVLVWDKNRKNDAKFFSVGHEYMLLYSRDKEAFRFKHEKLREPKEGIDEAKLLFEQLKQENQNDWEAIKKAWRNYFKNIPSTDPRKQLGRFTKVGEKGPFRDDGDISWPGGGGPRYEVLHPKTHKPCKVPAGGWVYSTPEKLWEEYDRGRVVFGDDETTLPRQCRFLFESEGQVMPSVFFSYAQNATMDFVELMGSRVFENPKNWKDIHSLIRYCAHADDLILDFFAGSGTTGHAVMAQNADDGGNRRFILVQLPEPLSPDNKEQKTALDFCDSLNLQRTIAELTKERVRRSAKKIQIEKPNFAGDLGFRVYKLDSTNIRPWDPNPQDISGSLFAAQEHLKDGRTEQDILTELLLKLGLPLTVPIEERAFGSHTLYAVGAGTLMACLSPRIEKEEVEALAQGMVAWHKELAPVGDSQVVLRDSAFRTDVAKANFTAILEQAGFDKRNIRSL